MKTSQIVLLVVAAVGEAMFVAIQSCAFRSHFYEPTLAACVAITRWRQTPRHRVASFCNVSMITLVANLMSNTRPAIE